MTKNKLAYFLLYGSPYGRKRPFLSAQVCVGLPTIASLLAQARRAGLWFKNLRVFSGLSACQAIASATAGASSKAGGEPDLLRDVKQM